MNRTTAHQAVMPDNTRGSVTHTLITLALALAVLVTGSATAHASPPAAASGIFSVTAVTSFIPTQVGANTFIHQTTDGIVAGTLAGSFSDENDLVLHPNGRIGGSGTLTCACTVDGRSGTIEFVMVSQGDFASQAFEGRAVITGGTGELDTLHGVLELQASVDPNGFATITYTGQIHFDQ